MNSKKQISAVLCSLFFCAGVLAGCGAQPAANGASASHSSSSGGSGSAGHYTRATKIDTVRNDAAFDGYGRLMFPVQTSFMSGSTLGTLRLTWYNHMNPDKTVEIANYFYDQVQDGRTIFYNIKTNGTDAEIEVFRGLHHGFGLGEGTVAEGWVDHAVAFWQRHMTTRDITQRI